MRILIISDVTGYMRGGVPAVTRQLVEGLAQRSHLVGFCGDIPLSDSTPARHFPLAVPTNKALADQVRHAIHTFAPDFVHVMAMGAKGMFSLLPVLAPHAWLLNCHSIPPHEQKFGGLHANEWLHYGARNTRYLPNSLAWRLLFLKGVVPQVVVHSRWVGDIAARYGYPSSRTALISLGCDASREPERRLALRSVTAPSIVTTGGIAHTKGYHDAITAVADIRQAFDKVTYQIIGEVRDASYLAYLRGHIARLGLQENVRITPNLPNDEKQRALAAADLYMQPSHEEGFCLAYIEAAMRVPRLVGADTGAIRLVSRGDAGARVVPPQRPQTLADTAKELLSSTMPPDLMQTRFDRLARDFSWRQYVDSHEALYLSMLNKSPSGARIGSAQ